MNRPSLTPPSDAFIQPALSRETIRALQQTRGELPCYQSDWRYECEKTDCEWRKNCFRLVAAWRR